MKPPPPPRQCDHCGKTFQPRSHVFQRFCASACYRASRAAYKRKVYAERAEERSVHTCQHCGVEFTPKTPDRTSFCSRDCAYAFKRERKEAKERARQAERETRQAKCPHCGRTYIARRSPEKRGAFPHCGQHACLLASGRARARAAFVSAAKPAPYVCIGCGATGVAPTAKGYQRCPTCTSIHAHRLHQEYKRTRRARKLGKRAQAISKRTVFERDGWRCKHCGRRVRPDYSINHDLYPHLDHIIPLARGGDHTWANVQLLCRACNIAKGMTIANEQLLLVWQ